MSMDQPIAWAASHLWQVTLIAGVLLAGCTYIAHRTSGAVLSAGLGALISTAYSADTSWRFAEHRLGMTDVDERAVMFAAGEAALLACAIMARANKQATATETAAGTPGVAGVLVWCITGIQIIPAYSESGFWGGTVRAVFGPVMASMLWHLAMGLEIRVSRPEALSTGLPAQIGHELRERLLSRLGLAVRGRTAEQVSRDRATARAVRLASRNHLGPWGRAALKASVARSGAAVDDEQRQRLLQLLAARRNASALRTVPVASPWVEQALSGTYPSRPLPSSSAERPQLGGPTPVADAPVPAADGDSYPGPGLQLYLSTGGQVGPEVACAVPAESLPTRSEVHARVPDLEPARAEQVRAPEDPLTFIRRRAAEERAAAESEGPTPTQVGAEAEALPEPKRTGEVGTDGSDGWDALLARAREVDAEQRRRNGRPASVHTLKTSLRVGQPRAQALRDALAADTTRKASR